MIGDVYPLEHAPTGVVISDLAEDLAANGHWLAVLAGWPSHPAAVLFTGAAYLCVEG